MPNRQQQRRRRARCMRTIITLLRLAASASLHLPYSLPASSASFPSWSYPDDEEGKFPVDPDVKASVLDTKWHQCDDAAVPSAILSLHSVQSPADDVPSGGGHPYHLMLRVLSAALHNLATARLELEQGRRELQEREEARRKRAEKLMRGEGVSVSEREIARRVLSSVFGDEDGVHGEKEEEGKEREEELLDHVARVRKQPSFMSLTESLTEAIEDEVVPRSLPRSLAPSLPVYAKREGEDGEVHAPTMNGEHTPTANTCTPPKANGIQFPFPSSSTSTTSTSTSTTTDSSPDDTIRPTPRARADRPSMGMGTWWGTKGRHYPRRRHTCGRQFHRFRPRQDFLPDASSPLANSLS
ncbi:hypothetical protein B0H13DRAFT_2060193 [Mycena leptocephala]|nr:hypothetical protein B0H13DRAFT_2060193 [Mycena leptocephala]